MIKFAATSEYLSRLLSVWYKYYTNSIKLLPSCAG